ncbi:hypothetical protein ABPG75_001500 [Micractinium tetrahymenae]
MEQNKRDEAGGLIDSQAAALNAQRLASELYRRTGPAKVRAAAEHVRALVDAGQKVLIFAHHAEVLDELQQRALAGVRCVRIDGQVNNEKRKPLVDRFQKDERCRAALLSITAAGVGITLTAASVVVFAELYWNPGSLVQAEDRAHRMGQRHPLEVHYLVAPGTGKGGPLPGPMCALACCGLDVLMAPCTGYGRCTTWWRPAQARSSRAATCHACPVKAAHH